MTERALVFTDEREVTVEETEATDPGANEVTVDAHLSAISSGTELLVYRGQAPSGIAADSSLETLNGDLSFPLQYGYALVGTVVDAGGNVDDAWVDREVIAFHPHQTRFTSTTDCLTPLPPDIERRAGALFPSAETATNFLLDGAPKLGERVVVFGAGVIGLCTIRLLAEFPLDSLVVVEPRASRRDLAREFGADEAVPPADVDALFESVGDGHADLVYELSGRPDTLNDAIDVVGYDGRIVVGSWYGSKRSDLQLGGSFHRDRVDLISSQVSTIDPSLRGRWSKDRRTDTALDALRTIDHEALITDVIPFERAGDAYERLDEAPDGTIQVLLSYD
ncbi:zinc-binding alcohol dehydrogenase [Halorubrum sp. 2020YC2]|uniref:zinc-dependent alcohol dehydrogenase n=1 Tax=Halorubrum sp. 2020YC2 TaxID=2836432 RepID=UPI001BE63E91|nr:zinc-binding alcohol dehydrogenase [Halorubrum sp. 2020YC2]QWC18176.1 zinc-binding alcohol dehydrogenase [Halorubrum sp. 2020YC2]